MRDVQDARSGVDASPDVNDGARDVDVDDEDLDLERELAALDRTRPSAHQRAGGAPRELAWLLTVAGALGLLAAVELVLSELAVAADPDAVLACDINPLVGCGTFITTWQAHALGIPNAVVGTAAFAALLTVGMMLLAGARVARWFWRALVAGVSLAVVALLFFQYHAFFTIRGLCPYCLVVWVVTIPVVVHVWARAVQAGHVPAPDWLRRALVADRWVIVAVWYAVVLLAVALVFWDQWLLLLS
ncbi:vitamin K epoxide reductase family protein [Georgenia sp. TF02-10]|uniref:vitamin K epoxide reductase family protein n=1 Tax=Georgenia sp. TF02-10 TaxID=2917725 RepID=UPI001FA6D442|nr:vitamin K epoxide reductase family protein [Georgenia sp. TF02-10]UNX53640.1 vitamin K epoxide reductase family protein [Georgenia sp. TF02-10]